MYEQQRPGQPRPQGAFPHLQSQFLFSLIERTRLIFPGSSVNDNNDVFFLVSFISIAILFLVIAFDLPEINLCQTSIIQESQ